MPKASIVEITILGILGLLLINNAIAGFLSSNSKKNNFFMWPLVVSVIACMVVYVAWVFLSLISSMSFWEVYYWRYGYLGCIPLVIFMAWAVFIPDWREIPTIILLLVTLVLTGFLGWLLNGVALIVAVGVVTASLTDKDYPAARVNLS